MEEGEGLRTLEAVDVQQILRCLSAAKVVNYGSYNNSSSKNIVLGLMPWDSSYMSFWICDMSVFKNVYGAQFYAIIPSYSSTYMAYLLKKYQNLGQMRVI